MSDDIFEVFKEIRRKRKEVRAKFGVPCPECIRLLPKAAPSLLLPQQKCKIHGYKDPRKRTAETEYL